MASISKRGEGYLAQVRIKKGGVVVFSESKTFPSEDLAESWSKRLEKEIKERGVPAVARRNITVSDLILTHLKYLKELRPIGRSAIHTYEYMATEFYSVKLEDLTSAKIHQFAARRRAEGVTPATILSNLSALSASFNAASHAHGIPIDPAPVNDAIKQLKDMGVAGRSREVIRLMEPDEEEALMAEFVRHNRHHQTTIDMTKLFPFAVAFPRRAGELTRIRWEDVDRKKRTVLIRDVKHPRKKMGNHQLVPILGKAWEILESLPILDERIFPHDTNSTIAVFERARNRIALTGMPKIKDLRFHDLRHLGITKLFQLGLSIQEVSVVSGHKNWAQLSRYTHIQPVDVHKSFGRLQDVNGSSP